MCSAKTKSEQIFEDFCNENGIHYEKIATGDMDGKKTPDYNLCVDGKLIIVEIKQIDANKEDAELIEKSKKGVVAFWSKAPNRVRNKINKARKQIDIDKDSIPYILVLYDNTGFSQINSHAILKAMYGDDIIEIYSTGEERNVFGGGKKFTEKSNTTFSAIAILKKDELKAKLSIFHNKYAKNPLPSDFLRIETVDHFCIKSSIEAFPNSWNDWSEC